MKRGAAKLANRVTESFTGCFAHDKPIEAGAVYKSERLKALTRQAAAESCVLLKNNGVLPLDKSDTIAVLGRCQVDWFYVGYGSGGGVHAPYYVNLLEGLRNAGANVYEPLAEEYERLCAMREYRADHGYWGHWPFSHPEIPLSSEVWNSTAEDLSSSERAAAIVVIGRAAGEDRDNQPKKGSWFLTDDERELLDIATGCFERVVVVLNIGSIMDLSWIEEYGDKLSAVLIAWLGGQESGNAVADVLCGKVNPSGRMPDTAARFISDWPSDKSFGGKKETVYEEGVFVGYRHFDKYAKESVLFPFGHGLSYTDFSVTPSGFVRTKTGVMTSLKVKNTGSRAGKNAVLLFARLPREGIDKPLRVLVGFKKTRELAPSEEQNLTIVCDNKSFSVFSEEKHAFILEPGEYSFEANGIHMGGFTLNEEETVEEAASLTPTAEERRKRIEASIPEWTTAPESVDHSLYDVMNGEITLDEFIADLSKSELEALSRGHGMMGSPLGPGGNAGVFGGITKHLRARGVPVLSCCDGPAGLRMNAVCTLIPCGTALAASFDTDLVEALHEELAGEMAFYNVDIRLAPGMNIHRHPLCGRNFEYFSEDPVLAGQMGAAVVRGIAAGGRAACPKHFACNNQEAFRTLNNSVVSERALREIYLRAFEICVKESRPLVIMTSYNRINGVYGHYHFDLVTTVLRGEWGFDGVVITDWYMRPGRSPEHPKLRDNAYRVRAQVDVLMPGSRLRIAKRYRSDGTLLRTLGKNGGITRAELMRGARNVLRVIIKLKKSQLKELCDKK